MVLHSGASQVQHTVRVCKDTSLFSLSCKSSDTFGVKNVLQELYNTEIAYKNYFQVP